MTREQMIDEAVRRSLVPTHLRWLAEASKRDAKDDLTKLLVPGQEDYSWAGKRAVCHLNRIRVEFRRIAGAA